MIFIAVHQMRDYILTASRLHYFLKLYQVILCYLVLTELKVLVPISMCMINCHQFAFLVWHLRLLFLLQMPFQQRFFVFFLSVLSKLDLQFVTAFLCYLNFLRSASASFIFQTRLDLSLPSQHEGPVFHAHLLLTLSFD